MTSTLRTLLDRVEKGEGADREIDALLEVAFDLRPSCYVGDKRKLIAHRDGYVQVGKGGPSWCSPVYTSSIDAAIYLVEKVVPGFRYGLNAQPGKLVQAWVADDTPQDRPDFSALAKSPARAVTAALLRAKIAQEERT